MSYFLKKTRPNKNKGEYLQIYETFYVPGVGKRNKAKETLGYVEELIAAGDKDPIATAKEKIKKLNEEEKTKKEEKVDSVRPRSLNVGFFLVKAMLDLLDIDEDINTAYSQYKCHYKFSDMLRTLIYVQILNPCSKYKAFEKVIPSIYGSTLYSYDQILDFTNIIGRDYHRAIEVFNNKISKVWERNYKNLYFDCTNYYFEIDLEKNHLKKGPSKENRPNPLLGQALLLDADQIPLDTIFYPGNESEKPFLRKSIEETKTKYNITGKSVQVADKGLNCARNIYSAVVEAGDGYIFSKGIRGTSLPNDEKEWVLAEDDGINKWTDVYDKNGELIYRYKCARHINKTNGEYVDYDKFSYKCKINPDDAKETKFTVREKRVLTYNPKLAKKQCKEINKEVEKLRKNLTIKQITKSELGDAAKFVKAEAYDENGVVVKIDTVIDEEKIAQAKQYCGYNLLVTSEIKMTPEDIYKTYHNLWRIEESFRILKTHLDARPVHLQKEHSIHGHFLICYLSLLVMRLLELKTFKDDLTHGEIVSFIREYNFTKYDDDKYVSSALSTNTLKKIKEVLGLSKLDNVYHSKKDIENLLQTDVEVD